jgi:hypothetical protein
VIAEMAVDLLAKVQSVPSLETSASLSIGGRSTDPGLLKVPLPAAWVSLKTDQTDEQDYTHGPGSGLILPSQRMMGTWAVMVFIPYIDDADLLATQFPLLEAVANAVHSTTTPAGFAWRYIGQRIALVYPDRLAYEQRFTLHYAMNSDPITT